MRSDWRARNPASLRAELAAECAELFSSSSRARWVTHSEFDDLRQQLSKVGRGFWKFVHPVQALRLCRFRKQINDRRRKELNDTYLRYRSADPELVGLNVEQRKAVLVQEDRTLVIAGAGTGKTHMMVAKAHDTVRARISRPEEIAFVTFTRSAADELRLRCSEIDGIEIGTIHHLAREVIVRAEGKRPRLSPLADKRNKIDRLNYIERWLVEAVQEDPSLLVDLHTRRAALERCRSPAVTVPPFVAVPPDRVRVRSWGEAQIALTLYLARIDYRYEQEFPVPAQYRSRAGACYSPDFYLPDDPETEYVSADSGIWFEHFAHDRLHRLPPEWSNEDRQRYETNREWKERLHSSLRTRFAVTEYGDIERCRAEGKSFPAQVLHRIGALGLSSATLPAPSEVQELIDTFKADDAEARHMRVTHEIDDWIRTFRQQAASAQTTSVGTQFRQQRDLVEEANALRRLAFPVMKRYVAHLEGTNTVDHEGTILQALQYVSDGTVPSPWHVLLIDEYQDVNPAQAAFVHALWRSAAPKRPRLTAVGDDWQAIFSFQGGDVALIRGFRDPASSTDPFHERVELRQTYRFGIPLARSTRHFATRDPNSIDREVVGLAALKPSRKWPSSIVLAAASLTERGRAKFGHAGDTRTCSVIAALSRIAEQTENQVSVPSVLVLGRKNIDIDDASAGAGGLAHASIQSECKKWRLSLEFSTVHKAKGREADYVIVVDSGPPKAAESGDDKALERALRPLRYGGRNDSEERRIWYVALTRARHKVYVINVAGDGVLSPYFDELRRNEGAAYDVSSHELAEYLNSPVPLVPCPKCARRGESSSVLVLRTGDHGPFVGCTSFAAGEEHHCRHKERPCANCGAGVMVRVSDESARCASIACGHRAPLCRCPVPKPMVIRHNKKTGEPFWGCQSYGTEGACRKTRSRHEPLSAGSRSTRHSERSFRARR